MTETSTVSSRDVAGVVGHVRNPQPMLSANQRTALQLLQEHGGSLIEWRVPETIEKDPVFGTVIPGITVYRTLERMGLRALFTVEESFVLPGRLLPWPHAGSVNHFPLDAQMRHNASSKEQT